MTDSKGPSTKASSKVRLEVLLRSIRESFDSSTEKHGQRPFSTLEELPNASKGNISVKIANQNQGVSFSPTVCSDCAGARPAHEEQFTSNTSGQHLRL